MGVETLGGIVGTIGLVVLGIAIWGLWKGRVGWAHLGSRGAAGVALGVGLVLMSVGGALIPDEERIASTGTSASEAPTTAVEPTTTIPATTTVPPTTMTMPATTTTAPPPVMSRSTTLPRPVVTTVARAVCHPSYEGECLPPSASDVDCAGGSGNGPVYARTKNIRVVGPDVYDLDRDGNGLACET